MYAQLMALSLLSFILLYKALKRPGWSLWMAYAVATVLNLSEEQKGQDDRQHPELLPLLQKSPEIF